MGKRIIACMLAVVLVFLLTACKSKDYEKAFQLKNASTMDQAANIFYSLGDYEDSEYYLHECLKDYVEFNFSDYENVPDGAFEFITTFAEKGSEFTKYLHLANAYIAVSKILNLKAKSVSEEGWNELKAIDLKSIDFDIGDSIYKEILTYAIEGDDDKKATRAFTVLKYFAENSNSSYIDNMKQVLEGCLPTNANFKRLSLEIGDTFTYGKYYYNLKKLSSNIVTGSNSSKDLVYAHAWSFDDADVEWLVLDKQGSKLLVTTKNVVDATFCMGKKKYNSRYEMESSDGSNTFWKDSYVREYLNETFKKYLLMGEHDYIIPTQIDDCDTKDSIFLLSLAEVEKYKSVKGYPASATPFAVARMSSTSLGYVSPYLDDYKDAANKTYAFATRRTADDPLPPDEHLLNSSNPIWVWITFANSKKYDAELGDKRYTEKFGINQFGKNLNIPIGQTQYLRPAMWVDFSE